MNMQFILKDGYIYLVKNEVSENNRVEGTVVLKYVEDYENKTFYYSVNDKPYKRLVNETIVIEKEELGKPYLDLKVKASSKEGAELFKTDRLPITYSLVVGGKIEDSYTQTMNMLMRRLDKVEKRLKDLEEVGELI
jgi:hypothetical protein